jgi:hypothetical protein
MRRARAWVGLLAVIITVFYICLSCTVDGRESPGDTRPVMQREPPNESMELTPGCRTIPLSHD